jgi:hypothetical protein
VGVKLAFVLIGENCFTFRKSILPAPPRRPARWRHDATLDARAAAARILELAKDEAGQILCRAEEQARAAVTDLRRQNSLNGGITEFIEILRDTVQANGGTAANRENFDAAFKGVNDGSEPLTRDFIEKIDAIFKDGGGDSGKTFANEINGGMIDKALGEVREAHQERAVAESEKQAEATRGPLGKLRAMQKELELLDAMPADQLTATHEARKHILTAGIGEFIKNLITALQAYSQTAEKGRKAALQLLT